MRYHIAPVPRLVMCQITTNVERSKGDRAGSVPDHRLLRRFSGATFVAACSKLNLGAAF